ncbi:hypothetical protein ACSVBT_05840 [Afipia sp. TerB]
MVSFRSGGRQIALTEDAYRAWLISRNPPPIVHHSSAVHWKRLLVRLHRASDFIDAVLHRAVAALAAAKTRRIRRELQWRGITYAPLTGAPESSRNKTLP